VVAVTPGGNITNDMILGFMAMSQIPNATQSLAKLRRLWLAEGLDDSFIPKQRRMTGVFQSACRAVETRRSEALKSTEIKVDEVLENEAECIYQITLLVRDKAEKLIEHPKAMRLTYNKRDGSIEDEPLDDKKAYKALKPLADKVRDEFDKNSSRLPGSKIRRAFRRTLRDQHSTLIQNKGVFFVPKAGKPTLDSLQNVMKGLYGDEGDAEMFIMAVANDEGERAVIAKHYQDNVTDQIDQLLAEITMRLKTEKPARGDRKETLVAERRRINEGIERYRSMLDNKLLVADEKIRLLDNGLEELLGL
jgi:hypothetical protein